MTHPLNQALANLANQISDLALANDPATRAGLKSLAGRCIEIRCTNPSLIGCLHIEAEAMRFSATECDQPNVVVRGTLTQFVAWLTPLTSTGHTGSGSQTPTVDGDETTLQEFMALLRQFTPDLQKPLGQWLGEDAATRLVAGAEMGINGVRSLLQGVGAELESRFKNQAQSGYTMEAEAEVLRTRLDVLRLRVDRLAARIALAEQSRAGNNPEPGT